MANGEVAVAPDGFAVGVAKRDAGMSRLVSIVFANYYVDSIMLAKLTAELSELNGIEVASVAMGTPFQHDELKRVGLADDTTRAAGPNDLVMALLAHSSADADVARQHFETALNSRARTGGRHEVLAAQTITQAARRSPDATVAFISVPGMFATVEAHQALVHGLVPVIFSDHVSLDDEVVLGPRRGVRAVVKVPGPDCGTAIIGNLALGFVNEVRRGGIGLIAACGTGAQEVSILIDKEERGS